MSSIIVPPSVEQCDGADDRLKTRRWICLNVEPENIPRAENCWWVPFPSFRILLVTRTRPENHPHLCTHWLRGYQQCSFSRLLPQPRPLVRRPRHEQVDQEQNCTAVIARQPVVGGHSSHRQLLLNTKHTNELNVFLASYYLWDRHELWVQSVILFVASLSTVYGVPSLNYYSTRRRV